MKRRHEDDTNGDGIISAAEGDIDPPPIAPKGTTPASSCSR
jgi:hypothetical protein